jgi:hypothetical protein
MPAHIPPPDSRLAVTFCRDADPPDDDRVRRRDRLGHAIALITQREKLQPGDTLTVRSLAESDSVAFGDLYESAP